MMINPKPNQEITVFDEKFYFDHHPLMGHIPYGQRGRKGIVYRLYNREGRKFALKIFNKYFSSQRVLHISRTLGEINVFLQMETANLLILSKYNSPKLIGDFPELENAILTPWFEGQTCLELYISKTALTQSICRKLSLRLSQILRILEIHGMAHTDLSSSNVLIAPDKVDVALVGLDNLFKREDTRPKAVSIGSYGYAHESVKKQGQWCDTGDRFAGAILISELLCWSYAQVRSATYGESYFAPDEIGKRSIRYNLMYSTLENISPKIANLFAQAWFSSTLSDCPSFTDWHRSLEDLERNTIAPYYLKGKVPI